LAQVRRELPSARALDGVRLLFLTLGLTGLVLGYLGLNQYVHSSPKLSGDTSVSNLIYYDVELALLQSTPLAAGGPVPGLLQVGRFCAPCVLVYPVAEFALAMSAGRLRRARTSRARGHTVVCGSTRAAQVLAARLRTNGTRVIVVSAESGDESRRDTVNGDPRAPRILSAAGVRRASRVYACLERGENNAEIVAAAEQLRSPRGGPDRIHVLIPDLDLCSALRARHWSVAGQGAQRLGFFNPDELAAQATVRADGAAFTGRTPHIAIVGTGDFARSVLIEFARQWVARGAARREPVQVALIGADAFTVANALSERYAFLAGACRIEPRTETFEQVLEQRRDSGAMPPLRRLYLCQQDENEALRAALDAAAHLQATFVEVVVRLDRMTGIVAGFRAGRDGGGALFDTLGGHLRLVDVTAEGCDPDLVEDDLAEWLARVCHQRHLVDQFGSGVAPGSSPAMVRWEELAEEYRESNRDQAADVGRKLAEIGCVLSPRRVGGPEFEYAVGELERLAELEHERWIAERTRRGWTWGPSRDEAGRLHPGLVPWRSLPETEREKDRRAVRSLPAMLADAGLAIIRMDSDGIEPDGRESERTAPGGLSPGTASPPVRSS
jgi:hypothetical protein